MVKERLVENLYRLEYWGRYPSSCLGGFIANPKGYWLFFCQRRKVTVSPHRGYAYKLNSFHFLPFFLLPPPCFSTDGVPSLRKQGPQERLYNTIQYNTIQYYIISYLIISYYILCYDIIWYYMLWYNIISFLVVSYYIV